MHVQWTLVVAGTYFVQTRAQFFLVAILAGTGLGAIQAASRTFMATLVPPGREGEFFGFYNLCGKSAAVLGPLMFGALSADGRLTYCNAGHNPPLVFGTGGVRRLEAGGPVVGLLEFAPYDQETVQLAKGDTVVIFSDGVSEALNSAGEEFGDDRLQAEVERGGSGAAAMALVERLVAGVKAFTKGAPQSDDITVMVIRYLGA